MRAGPAWGGTGPGNPVRTCHNSLGEPSWEPEWSCDSETGEAGAAPSRQDTAAAERGRSGRWLRHLLARGSRFEFCAAALRSLLRK